METKVTTFKPAMPIGRNLALIGALGLGIASFLAWGEVADVSVSGMEGDGVITLVLAILCLAFLFIKKVPLWIVAILGAVAEAIGIIDFIEMNKVANDINGTLNSINGAEGMTLSSSVGIGLYITIVAAGLIVIGSLIQLFQNRK